MHVTSPAGRFEARAFAPEEIVEAAIPRQIRLVAVPEIPFADSERSVPDPSEGGV